MFSKVAILTLALASISIAAPSRHVARSPQDLAGTLESFASPLNDANPDATTEAVSSVTTGAPMAPGSQCDTSSNTVHCCDSDASTQLTKTGGAIGWAAFQSLMGQCSDITVPVMGGAVGSKSACDQQPICCGPQDGQGFFNVGCVPIIL